MACSVSLNPQSKSFFQAKYVFDVKDPNAMNDLISQSAGIWSDSGITDMYKEIGVDMDFKVLPKTEDYNGVTIYSANLAMAATDPNSEEGKMINTMYGDGFDYKWAFIDKTCIATLGLNIKKTIDRVKAANATQIASEMQALNTYIPNADKADVFGTYNLVRAIKMSMDMMRKMPGSMITEPLDITSKSNLFFASNAKNGKLTTDIVLPKEHLMEIVNAQKIMTLQMMKAYQPATTSK